MEITAESFNSPKIPFRCWQLRDEGKFNISLSNSLMEEGYDGKLFFLYCTVFKLIKNKFKFKCRIFKYILKVFRIN